MKYLGIDYGTKKVGIALSDEEGNMAFPSSVIENDALLFERIVEVIKKEHIQAIVMGESLDYKGKANPVMKNIVRLKEQLKARLQLPVYLEPETLTSAEAKRQPLESHAPRSRKQDKHKKVDASAAALILQSYLDRIRNKKSGIMNERKEDI